MLAVVRGNPFLIYLYLFAWTANQESNIGRTGDFDLIEVYALYSKLSIGSNSYPNHSLLVCFSQIMLMLNISKLYNRFAFTLRICQSPILSISVQELVNMLLAIYYPQSIYKLDTNSLVDKEASV